MKKICRQEKNSGEDDLIMKIRLKIQEIYNLITKLPFDDKQFIKKFLTESVHEIFLLLDSKLPATDDNIGHQSKKDVDLLERSIVAQETKTELQHDNENSNLHAINRNEEESTDKSENLEKSRTSIRLESQNEIYNADKSEISKDDCLPFVENKQLPDDCKDSSNIRYKLNDEVEVDSDENYESTCALMDEIDEIKPKSNIPFVKDESPDTCTTGSEDVSSLLSFLPQLSPYIKFDPRESCPGENHGFVHLSVERADGSVQNLKVAATTFSDKCTQLENDSQQKSNIGEKQLSLIQKDLMNRENEKSDDTNHTVRTLKKNRQNTSMRHSAEMDSKRGRPRKPEVYESTLLADGKKVFVCGLCNGTAQTQYAMTVHMRKHSGVRPYSCDICDKSFTTKGNLKHHIATHDNTKTWKCGYCEKMFKEKRVLMVHERIHKGERPYKCNLCDKAFTQNGVLKEHLLTHSGEKPHLCDLCGQEFRGISSLRAHKLRHLKKKDYQCDQCEKSFVTQGDLNRHYLTHTGEKPFLCTLCPKSFTRLNYLKEHLNVHYGNKPYACTECSAAFSDNISLNRHKKKHKTEKEDSNKLSNKSELQKQLVTDNQSIKMVPSLPNLEIIQQTNYGDQTFQLILNDNTTMEDIQKLQNLLSSGSSMDIQSEQGTVQPGPPIYQVMCVNPDTQEIVGHSQNDQTVVEGQTAYLSAINMLANATSQANFSI